MQLKHMLIGVKATQNGLLFCLVCDKVEGEYYECEISDTVDPDFNASSKEEDSKDDEE
jgi:hypothetical protein